MELVIISPQELSQPLPARKYYEAQLETIAGKLDELQARSRRMTWVRTGLFFAAAIGLLLGYAGVENGTLLLVGGWMAAAAFMVAIVWHEHLRLKVEELSSHQRLFQQLIARLNRDWDSIPAQRLLPEFDDLPFTDDLDVGGPCEPAAVLKPCRHASLGEGHCRAGLRKYPIGQR